MVLLIEGVVNEFPLAIAVPPVALAYQLIVESVFPITDNATVPTPQRAAEVILVILLLKLTKTGDDIAEKPLAVHVTSAK